jgi:DUF971 family protein
MADDFYPVEMAPGPSMSLRLKWNDGHESVYPPGYLRYQCTCAHCVDEMTGQRKIKPEDIAKDIHPLRADPIGRYAIKIAWSDGHADGLYTFDRLRALCPCAACSGIRRAGSGA